ncbi:MAG: aminopeptidase N, partial [Pseudorhodobacter sp.]
MQDLSPTPVRLADYRPFPFRIDRVSLRFRLAPRGTVVTARLEIAPVPGGEDLRLDGEALRLVSLRLDGQALDLRPDDRGLTIPATLLPEGAFALETEVEIDPADNTALEGLYLSNGMYCTQC